MFGGDGLTKDLEFDRATGGFKGSGPREGFSFAQSAAFQDGEYLFRFLPPDVNKAPHGYRVVRYHEIEVQPGGGNAGKVNILHPSSFPIPIEEPSYIDEVLECFSEVPASKIPDSLREVLASLKCKTRYLFPTVWRASAYQEGAFTNYKPSSTSIAGVIWDVRAPTLVDKIAKISTQFPDANDLDKGRWLRFRKARYDYSISEGPEEPLPSDARALLPMYPNLSAMFTKWQADRLKTMALLKSAWFAPMIEKFVSLSE